MAKYMDQTGAQHFAEALMSATKTINGQTIWGDGNIEAGGSAIQTTYSAFKTLVENGELVPGAQYIMTDYQAVPNATYAKRDPGAASEGNAYLIIRALTADAYDENASLVEVKQAGGVEPVIDVYNIKYTIENKDFIDLDLGRGTITYMHDPVSGNTAPWDWRSGAGIVSKDATKSTFNTCTNCTIARGDSDNIPCITFESCTDCNIGYGCNNIHIGDEFGDCQRVNIKNNSSNIYLHYVYDCNIGCGCNNIHIGDDMGNYLTQYMNIGNYCSYILVLPPSEDSVRNVIGNNCRYIQFAGSDIVIGNNCIKIYLTGYTGNTGELRSHDVTVGNNCSGIGCNNFFADFDSLRTNDIHFSYCSIGDNCADIRSSAINVSSSSYACMFSYCDFQNISGFYIKPITTVSVTISYKIFKNISTPTGFPLDTSASLPTNWKTTRGDISYDADSHRFAFRAPTDSTWTDIH